MAYKEVFECDKCKKLFSKDSNFGSKRGGDYEVLNVSGHYIERQIGLGGGEGGGDKPVGIWFCDPCTTLFKKWLEEGVKP